MPINNRRLMGLKVGEILDNETFALLTYEQDLAVRKANLVAAPVGEKESFISGIKHKGGMPDGDRYRSKITFSKYSSDFWEVIEKAEVDA